MPIFIYFISSYYGISFYIHILALTVLFPSHNAVFKPIPGAKPEMLFLGKDEEVLEVSELKISKDISVNSCKPLTSVTFDCSLCIKSVAHMDMRLPVADVVCSDIFLRTILYRVRFLSGVVSVVAWTFV